jgi:hypothetical protein
MTYETFGRLVILAIFDFESKSAQKRRVFYGNFKFPLLI